MSNTMRVTVSTGSEQWARDVASVRVDGGVLLVTYESHGGTSVRGFHTWDRFTAYEIADGDL